jgi:predicted nucleic acid-binding protein
MNYYVDTCIYLNLWKKEEEGEKLYWLLAKNFLEKLQKNGDKVFYSGFILKELLFILPTDEFIEKRNFFEDKTLFNKIILSKEEYNEASKIKNSLKTDCSLFDIIHILLAKKTNSCLVTRDKDLISLSKHFNLQAKFPEDV